MPTSNSTSLMLIYCSVIIFTPPTTNISTYGGSDLPLTTLTMYRVARVSLHLKHIISSGKWDITPRRILITTDYFHSRLPAGTMVVPYYLKTKTFIRTGPQQ